MEPDVGERVCGRNSIVQLLNVLIYEFGEIEEFHTQRAVTSSQ